MNAASYEFPPTCKTVMDSCESRHVFAHPYSRHKVEKVPVEICKNSLSAVTTVLAADLQPRESPGDRE
jgi:hypothetical protein